MRTKDTAEKALAEKLCLAYAYERREYERLVTDQPSRYRVPRMWAGPQTVSPEAAGGTSVWVRLARLCHARNADPIRYVQWSLAISQLAGARPPEPNQLVSPRRVSAYLAGGPARRQMVAQAFRFQCKQFLIETAYYQRFGDMTGEDSYVCVLRCTQVELSALFRFGLALSIVAEAKEPRRFHRIARLFEGEALLQYHHDPAGYDATWPKDMIPPDFAARAERFYDEVIRRHR